jgi:hypothetical protein
MLTSRKGEGVGAEGGKEGAAVNAAELALDAFRAHVAKVGGRDGEPAGQLAARPSGGRREDPQLVVPGGVGHEDPVAGQEVPQSVEAGEVIVDLPDRDYVEPADHLGNQAMVLLASLPDTDS